MLRELRIRNFAVIESVAVEFRPGLNVLTGETGAGKSMLIDAILLVRGARAQTDVIRSDADTATVEARFEITPGSPAAAVLEGAGILADNEEFLIRRELARSGRHRAFVNDSLVTVALLRRSWRKRSRLLLAASRKRGASSGTWHASTPRSSPQVRSWRQRKRRSTTRSSRSGRSAIAVRWNQGGSRRSTTASTR